MRISLTTSAILALLICGCQVEPDKARHDAPDPANEGAAPEAGAAAEQGVARLTPFESEAEFESFFKDQILSYGLYVYEQSNTYDSAWDNDAVFEGFQDDFAAGEDYDDQLTEGPVAGVAPSAGGDWFFSPTTIQAAGVDEADVVKTDGSYLYIAVPDLPLIEEGGQLHIVQAAAGDELQLLSTFPLEGWFNELYLAGDRVVVVTAWLDFFSTGLADLADIDSAFFQRFLDALSSEDATSQDDAVIQDFVDYALGLLLRPRMIVTVVDVSDRSNPKLVSKTAFDGHLAASRMIDGVVRLVIHSEYAYYVDIMRLDQPQLERLLDAVDLDSLLPRFETTDAAGQVTGGLISRWEDYLRPADPSGSGLTNVITLDLTAPSEFDAVAILADAGLVYASTEALYLTDSEWYFDFLRVDTDIYKFAFEPGTVSLAAAGTVPGRVLCRYSMSEYQGHLRVVTTTDDLFDWDSREPVPGGNRVYVLGEQDGALSVVGLTEELAAGERLLAARLMGPRGYVSTTDQSAGLTALDLSDPANPRIAGNLEVSAFDAVLLPTDDDHLLVVSYFVDPEGVGWMERVQLSLFDVSDVAAPLLVDRETVAGGPTFSEALLDPRALTWFAQQDLLALPIRECHWMETNGWFGTTGLDHDADPGQDDLDDGAGPDPQQSPTGSPEDIVDLRWLAVYRVTAEDGLAELGRIRATIEGASPWYQLALFTRGVFIQDHAYAVTHALVAAAPLADLTTVTGLVELPAPEELPWLDTDVDDQPADSEQDASDNSSG